MSTFIKAGFVTLALCAGALATQANPYSDVVTKGQIMHPKGAAEGTTGSNYQPCPKK